LLRGAPRPAAATGGSQARALQWQTPLGKRTVAALPSCCPCQRLASLPVCPPPLQVVKESPAVEVSHLERGALGWYQASMPFNGEYDPSNAARTPNSAGEPGSGGARGWPWPRRAAAHTLRARHARPHTDSPAPCSSKRRRDAFRFLHRRRGRPREEVMPHVFSALRVFTPTVYCAAPPCIRRAPPTCPSACRVTAGLQHCVPAIPRRLYTRVT
jgi:hypothetical protein